MYFIFRIKVFNIPIFISNFSSKFVLFTLKFTHIIVFYKNGK